ncbi:hypothetical protein C2G38_2071846 [Gigaspora rosea]|uniref:Uncharacterized protein n=1 Tax=Gigaspora rosea TaxID=44941 RepID=A0A397VUU2_9GLOM|nr:hypothetical protein C2G38_2071846 [Gigaspora rosea]
MAKRTIRIFGNNIQYKSGRLKLQTSGYIQSAPKYSLFNTALFTNDNGYMVFKLHENNILQAIYIPLNKTLRRILLFIQ